ncbi:MAG TPA: tRNA (adenosine(37)-N6)-threonylcarbamoyltransferase complex dimerization subunit type 1 TsaB [Terriglobales bacterium]|jgi:tRNA threonylcarbamoyladenosine biosynthesis protein TsaB
MLVLAADTSGSDGSIALASCEGGDTCTVLEVASLEGGTFSAQLIPQIATLLRKHRLTTANIDAFAVVSGPGSFTGLRVGLAGIKALAEVTGKPIAAVSMLAAVAHGTTGRVTSALYAGRQEFYICEYEDGLAVSAEQVTSQDNLSPRAIVVTPDKAVFDYLSDRNFPAEQIIRPRSDVVALLGWRKILSGETVSPETLDANYVRRSDAEILIKP